MMVGPITRNLLSRWFGFAAACGLVAATATGASANLIRFDYGGVIASADPSTGIEPGTRFSGSFAYDPAGAVAGIGFEGLHSYDFGRSDGWHRPTPDSSGLTLDIGGKSVYAYHGGLGLIVTGDETFYAPGRGTSISIHNADIGGLSPLGISIDLSNPHANLDPSLAPPTSLNLGDFPSATLSVYWTAPGGPQQNLMYRGTIDTLTLTPTISTPEPTSLTLLAMAVAGWLARQGLRRRRRPTPLI